MAKKKKTNEIKTKVWISRNEELFSDRVYIYINKEPFHKNGMFAPGRGCKFVCDIPIDIFKKMFKFTLLKNTCRQYEISFKAIIKPL